MCEVCVIVWSMYYEQHQELNPCGIDRGVDAPTSVRLHGG